MALHIDIPTPAQLATLLDTRAPDCVSIYLPTSPLPQDADQARIEFKNLVTEAGTDNELLDDFAEDLVAWSLLAHSLAVFATPTSLRSFRLPNQLSSLVVSADRFHVKPLLRAITFPQAALVLALSQNSVRLVEVAGDVPPSTIDVAGLEAVIAEQPLRYARQVDRALQPTLAGLGLPLILAAAEPISSFYRATNSYPDLLDDGIAGNPEHMTEAELAHAARPILDALYAAELDTLRARFEDVAVQGPRRDRPHRRRPCRHVRRRRHAVRRHRRPRRRHARPRQRRDHRRRPRRRGRDRPPRPRLRRPRPRGPPRRRPARQHRRRAAPLRDLGTHFSHFRGDSVLFRVTDQHEDPGVPQANVAPGASRSSVTPGPDAEIGPRRPRVSTES